MGHSGVRIQDVKTLFQTWFELFPESGLTLIAGVDAFIQNKSIIIRLRMKHREFTIREEAIWKSDLFELVFTGKDVKR